MTRHGDMAYSENAMLSDYVEIYHILFKISFLTVFLLFFDCHFCPGKWGSTRKCLVTNIISAYDKRHLTSSPTES